VTNPEPIQQRALRDFLRWLGGASDGATVWEAPGITAAVVPATPQRSLINSVVYEDPAALEAAYDRLVDAYADAGVAGWTVWTPDHDAGAIELLTGRGHAFDGEPVAMTLDLGRFEPRDPGDLDWDTEASFDELGRINDEAYGLAAPDGIAGAMAGAADGVPIRIYRARRGGETASVLATIDHDDDLGIYFVATRAEHGRQGLAGRLLTAALVEGRERGMRTSSLQSSAKGDALYTRLGYERHFRLHLYERRGG
jgi:ribosomal protein S18 acetylase RimI-like enzyme